MLEGELAADFAERPGKRTIGGLRTVARDQGPGAQDSDELKWQDDCGRRWQDQLQLAQPSFDTPHLLPWADRPADDYVPGVAVAQSRSSTTPVCLPEAATRVPILSQRKVTRSCFLIPMASAPLASQAVTSQESPDSCSAVPSAAAASVTVPVTSMTAPPIFCLSASGPAAKSRCSASAVVLYTGRCASAGGVSHATERGVSATH